MFDYIFGIATPELGYPMFGDTSRTLDLPEDRSQWQLYPTLMQGTKVFGDPKYAARAALDYQIPVSYTHLTLPTIYSV